MANTQIKAIITADDRASAVVANFGKNVDSTSNKLQNFGQKAQGALAGITAIGVGAGLALSRLVDVLGDSVDAANKNQAALTGLASVARAFGTSQEAANKAARDLAGDGLLSVTDAAKGLKNLLASGFSLPQAVTLMNRFKDSAAFGRQSALSFGDAVASATEGIKNGNSILVDNAGVTKNLSVILTEAGYSAQDLQKATTDVNVRQALFNGILKETNAQLGDAAKLADSFAGRQAVLTAQTTILKERLGTALQPILLNLLQTITPIVEKISAWIEKHPQLAATIVIGTAVFLGLLAVLAGIAVLVGGLVIAFGALGAAIVGGVGIAIAAVGALAVAVVLNWDKIRNKISQLPDWVRSATELAGQALLRLLGPIGVVVANIGKIFDMLSKVKSLGGSIGAGFKPLQIPGFAQGTNYAPGGAAIVGERGPELVNLPRGSKVTPNNQFKSGNQTVNITVQAGAFMGNPADARKYAQLIAEALKDVAGAKNMTASQMLS